MNATVAPTPARAFERPPDAVLIEPSPTVEAQVSAMLADLGLRVRVTEEIPEDLSGVSLLLVEADRGFRTIALAREARARWPELSCAGVLRWWNEDERELAALVDFILHVPVRPQELKGLTSVALTAKIGIWQSRAAAVRTGSLAPAMPAAAVASPRQEVRSAGALKPAPVFFAPASATRLPSVR